MKMFLIRAGLILFFSLLLTGLNAAMNVFDSHVEAAVKAKLHQAQIDGTIEGLLK
jgi:hypothetical protein